MAIVPERPLQTHPRLSRNMSKSLADIILYPFPLPVVAWALYACHRRSAPEDAGVVAVVGCHRPRKRRRCRIEVEAEAGTERGAEAETEQGAEAETEQGAEAARKRVRLE
jgi:hypothetical protein